eukprot:9359533-Pyramimonas_sp.AAC.1
MGACPQRDLEALHAALGTARRMVLANLREGYERDFKYAGKGCRGAEVQWCRGSAEVLVEVRRGGEERCTNGNGRSAYRAQHVRECAFTGIKE